MVFAWSKGAEREASGLDGQTVQFHRGDFDRILSAAGGASWTFDEASDAFSENGSLVSVFGKTFPTVARQSLLTQLFFPGQAESGVKSGWHALWDEGTMFDHAYEIERYTGERAWIRMIATVRGADGARVFTGFVVDIDAEKRASMAASSAIARAEETEARRSDEIAELSHEIRTPLNGVIGLSQALALTELDEAQRSHVETILTSGRALMAILDASVDLCRLEAGGMEKVLRPFSIEQLVRETLELAANTAVSEAVELSFDVAEDCRSEGVGDVDRIRQVLTNLVHNALKYTEEGFVNVEVSRTDDGLARFIVHDSGPGIAAEDCARVFDRFAQTAGARPGGAGLGLSIAKKLVEFMGGEIGVESVIGRGSAFWFDLPLFEPVAEEAEADESTGDDGGLRVLIAEDDPINQKVFIAALAPLKYEVVIAQNGREALEQLASARFDLVLMDINMPVMSGEEAIVQIRASDEPWSSVPIIVVTALTSRDSRRYYHSIGANDYLPKPIDISVLTKKCENLIGPAQLQA